MALLIKKRKNLILLIIAVLAFCLGLVLLAHWLADDMQRRADKLRHETSSPLAPPNEPPSSDSLR